MSKPWLGPNDKSDVCSRSKSVSVVMSVFPGVSGACGPWCPAAAFPLGHTCHQCVLCSPCSFKSLCTPSCWPCAKTSLKDGGRCRQFWKPAGFIRKEWLYTQPLPVSTSVGWWAWCWAQSLRSVLEPIFPIGESLAVYGYWNINQPNFS